VCILLREENHTASCNEEEGTRLSKPLQRGKNSSTLLCAEEEDSA